mmetsp:Transcript_32753/g.64896  ORF Transcript_32753/g.64896 Transcript_32753/m.64896 type:complete len:326 (-) Transcript_32753:120-1097(-)
MTSNPLFIIVALSSVILAPMSQFGCVVAFFCTARGSFLHMPKSSSFVRSLKAPPLAVRMTLLSPPSGTPCRHWKIALCSLSAGSMLTPCFSTSGSITGPPLISVSLLASAMSLPSLIASMVGSRPAAPTIPVTTVSAPAAVAAATVPSSPNSICSGRGAPAATRRSLSSTAAASVAIDAIVGRYAAHCSAMRAALVPADSASISKFCGHAETMSRVCVPIDPVHPRRDSRFLKVAPSSVLSRVSFWDDSEFTGAAGRFSQPSPVPAEPETRPEAKSGGGEVEALRDGRNVWRGGKTKAEAPTAEEATRPIVPAAILILITNQFSS